jgi:hypothetical protein
MMSGSATNVAEWAARRQAHAEWYPVLVAFKAL